MRTFNANNSRNSKKEKNISEPLSSLRKKWIIASNLFTFYIPDCCLNKNRDIRQAFREKISILIIIILFSLILLFLVALVPQILCPNVSVITWKTIYKSNSQIMVLTGKVLDVEGFYNIHQSDISNFEQFLGQDVSYMFEFPSPSFHLPKTIRIYPDLVNTYLERRVNDTQKYCSLNYCHAYSNETNSLIDSMYTGDLIYTYSELNDLENP